MRIFITTAESYIRQTGRWLPHDREILKEWLERMLWEASSNPKTLIPAVLELQKLIENDTALYMQACRMFDPFPSQEDHLDKEPPSAPQIRSYQHMLQVLNHIITSAPKWDDFLYRVGLVGFPVNAILNRPMSTPSGKAFFINDRVNSALKTILNRWAEHLCSPASTNVLSLEDGWLSPSAQEAIMNEAQGASNNRPSFAQTFLCDPSLPHHGFRSWDDFFTRRLRPGARPVAGYEDDRIIVNACESRPYRLTTHVAPRDRFWLKSQPYSLTDMLAHDPLTARFVGGTVYQAYLSALSYHRWHSPVSGRVVRAYVKAGSYFSLAPSCSFQASGDGCTDPMAESQAYLAEVATRALIFIEADNAAIGLVCVMPIGIAECSTCEIAVGPGQRVRKGEELGRFRFGGSSYCMLFEPKAALEWAAEASMAEEGGPNLQVNSRLATVV